MTLEKILFIQVNNFLLHNNSKYLSTIKKRVLLHTGYLKVKSHGAHTYIWLFYVYDFSILS